MLKTCKSFLQMKQKYQGFGIVQVTKEWSVVFIFLLLFHACNCKVFSHIALFIFHKNSP